MSKLINLLDGRDIIAGSAKGSRLVLCDPVSDVEFRDKETNEPTLYIDMYGPESDVYREMDNAITDRRIQKAKGKRQATLTAAELKQDSIKLIASVIYGWSPSVSIDGENPLEFTPDNAVMLLTRVPWIREQCDDFLQNTANFMKNK